MRIGELSRETGASVRSLRHYEKQGLLSSARQSNGYRLYDDGAAGRVKTIRAFISLGMNTDEIAKLLECAAVSESRTPRCELAVRMYEERLAEVNEKIRVLEEIRAGLVDQVNGLRK